MGRKHTVGVFLNPMANRNEMTLVVFHFSVGGPFFPCESLEFCVSASTSHNTYYILGSSSAPSAMVQCLEAIPTKGVPNLSRLSSLTVCPQSKEHGTFSSTLTRHGDGACKEKTMARAPFLLPPGVALRTCFAPRFVSFGTLSTKAHSFALSST